MIKAKPKRVKRLPMAKDIYKGIDPELAKIGRAHHAKPMKSIHELYVPGVLDHKTADEIDADISKMREG